MKYKQKIRPGLKDIWNAYMAKDASFTDHDIPFCPTTANNIPNNIITWVDAKAIYKKTIRKNPSFIYDAFVCFYIDDYKFDGPKGIWQNPENALDILKHFSGTITPDFSTYQDFPEAIKLYAIYRMRIFGYWLGCNGINVINNVRWGSPETWNYCYNGIPTNSIVAIGTVGGSPRKLIDRKRFEDGLFKMVDVLKPHTIIVYGSDTGKCFDKLKEQGIIIVSYKSKTAEVFERRIHHE